MKTTDAFRNVIRKLSITINLDKKINIKYDNMHFLFMFIMVLLYPLQCNGVVCLFSEGAISILFIHGTLCF